MLQSTRCALGRMNTACSWAAPRPTARSRCSATNVHQLPFSPDSKPTMFTAANEGQWNAQRFMAHHMGVNALAFAPSGGEESLPAMGAAAVRFATGGCDNLIKIWRYSAMQPTAFVSP